MKAGLAIVKFFKGRRTGRMESLIKGLLSLRTILLQECDLLGSLLQEKNTWIPNEDIKQSVG